MNKSCGGCCWWQKISRLDGLCNFNDYRCGSDYHCSDWKGKKYERQPKININDIVEHSGEKNSVLE